MEIRRPHVGQAGTRDRSRVAPARRPGGSPARPSRDAARALAPRSRVRRTVRSDRRRTSASRTSAAAWSGCHERARGRRDLDARPGLASVAVAAATRRSGPRGGDRPAARAVAGRSPPRGSSPHRRARPPLGTRPGRPRHRRPPTTRWWRSSPSSTSSAARPCSPPGHGGLRRSRCRARSAAGSVTPARPPRTRSGWPPEPSRRRDPEQRVEASELARSVGRLIAHELTPHQREVLIALTIEETSANALAARLDSTPGAALQDAPRRPPQAARWPGAVRRTGEPAHDGRLPQASIAEPTAAACDRHPNRPQEVLRCDDGSQPHRSRLPAWRAGRRAPRPGAAVRTAAARLLLRRAPDPRAACAKHGLELDEVLAALGALDERDLRSAGIENRDWRQVGWRSCAPISSRCTTTACVRPSPGSSACSTPWSGFTATASPGSATLSAASARSAVSWSRTWPARRASCSRPASPQTRPARLSTSSCSSSTKPSTRRSATRSAPCGSCVATTIARPRSATPTERSSTRSRPSSRISTARPRGEQHPAAASTTGAPDAGGRGSLVGAA